MLCFGRSDELKRNVKFDLSFASSTTHSPKIHQIPLKPGQHLPKFVYLKVIIHKHSHEEAALKNICAKGFFCMFVALSLHFNYLIKSKIELEAGKEILFKPNPMLP